MQQHRKPLFVSTRTPTHVPIPSFVGKDPEARKSFAHMHLMSLCQQFNIHVTAAEHREYALTADKADDLAAIMARASELIVEKLKTKKLSANKKH